MPNSRCILPFSRQAVDTIDTCSGTCSDPELLSKVHILISYVLPGAIIRHPDNDWMRRSPDYNLAWAADHLRLLHDDHEQQGHPAHAATRLPMALALQEFD
jgi:hypothetical protein